MTSLPVLSLDLQGHRGARGLAPENTIAAFARALQIGVTTLELDCAVTKDGVVVVSHDPLLNPDITRGSDGQWLEGPGPPIASLEFAALQRYDVGRIRPGTAYSKRFSQQQPFDGMRIPNLTDVFALVLKSGNHKVRFNIETKISPLEPDQTALPDAFARALIAVIRREELAARVTIQSFDWRTLSVVQTKAPEIPTIYLTAEQGFLDNIRAKESSSPWTAPLHVSQYGGSIPKMVKAAGGAVWSPYYQELTRESLREAHGLGLKVVAWTVNEEADMKSMIALGVDGIISDYPDRLRKIAGEAGLTLPAATPVAP
ncbi:MAG: glycerophosphodiester phosphodiesterase [Betaproteobacteria bacterium]|nr:glycerophosphodiester phosphodiesterase [Betaproteobacteria bacterium]